MRITRINICRSPVAARTLLTVDPGRMVRAVKTNTSSLVIALAIERKSSSGDVFVVSAGRAVAVAVACCKQGSSLADLALALFQ